MLVDPITILFTIICAQIAVGWWFIHYLLANQRGRKQPRRALIIACVFGAVAIGIALGLELLTISDKITVAHPEALHRLSAGFLLYNAALVGLIEESAKALPLAVFMLTRRRYFHQMTDGLVYWGIAGITFGVLEDIEYTLHLGPVAGIGKIIVGPFSHAGFSVLIGWGIARYRVLKKPAWNIALGALAAMSLHALYDFGLFYARGWSILMSLAIAITVNVMIFVLFKRALKIDQARGIAAVGKNTYCRNCGWPNPKHYVFCVRCGQKT